MHPTTVHFVAACWNAEVGGVDVVGVAILNDNGA